MPRKSTPGKLSKVDVLEALRKHNWSVRETAKALDVNESSIHEWKRLNKIVAVRSYGQSQS